MKQYITMRYVRTEYGKKIHKDFESGKLRVAWAKIRKLEPRPENIVNTITTVQKDNAILEVEMEDYKIRQLTPKECWRLMGFSDKDFEAAAEVNSNTQLYAQAGNSIVVDVLEAIFKNMLPEKK